MTYLEVVFQSLRHFIPSVPMQSFWKLLVTGSYGPYSRDWVNVFSELFALHLLVISGSQAQGLATFWRLGLGFLPTPWRAPTYRMLFSLNFLIWLIAIRWPAPLTRAFGVMLPTLWWPRLSGYSRLGLGLSFQVAFFPEHLRTRSFYLSWLCYLCVVITARLFRSARPLWAHLSCWVLGSCFFLPRFRNFTELVLLFVLNLFFLVTFDFFLIPVAGAILGLSFLVYLGPGDVRIFDTFMPQIVGGATQLIVVVICFFRYILKYDL